MMLEYEYRYRPYRERNCYGTHFKETRLFTYCNMQSDGNTMKGNLVEWEVVTLFTAQCLSRLVQINAGHYI